MMTVDTLRNINSIKDNTGKMPVLFLGHGSPMNAIEENEFVQGFRNMGKEIPCPKAILCISAHWETCGTFVSANENPPTIHDFGGFPKALFDFQYPASGHPELAKMIASSITQAEIKLDYNRGLDHGAWSVIKHLFPKADIPVIMMSLDFTKSPQEHYDLARALYPLRKEGILIVCSGNIVHNLQKVAWSKMNKVFGYDWAIAANEKIKTFLIEKNYHKLIDFHSLGDAFNLAIPTSEHYLPLLYAVALQDKNEELEFFNDKIVAGSLSMTSVKIG